MAQREATPISDTLKIVAGTLAGAGVALLLAPKAGKETRKDVVRYAKTMGRKTDAIIHDFADELSSFADTVGDKATEILQAGADMTPEAKKGILAAIEKGQDRLEKQKNRLAKMIG